MTTIINVARDFSRVPAGRYSTDGPYSGESFREVTLKPAISGAATVVVELDGGEGYGSSFLEEAFGGLVRKGYFASEELHQKLRVVSQDEALVEEVWSYIDRAKIDNTH